MKKLPLAIAMVSFLAVSTSFAQQYYQDFEVSLSVPSNVNVEAFQRQVVNLDMDDLSKAMNSDGVLLGSMNIQTTARHCYARITTNYHFRLSGPTELPYTLEYIATNSTGNSITTTFGVFDPNYGYDDNEKGVGCNMGDLKMRLSRTEQGIYNISNGIYNDIIRVEVRAES